MLRISLAALLILSGCTPTAPTIPTAKSADRNVWPFSRHPEGFYSIHPASIRTTGATTFTLNGVKCRLLGLKEPTDEEMKSEAIKYVENWIADCGDCIQIINFHEPLVINGMCAVWITSTPRNLKNDLNKGLLSNQLVDLDLDEFKDYKINEFSKDGRVFEIDWKGYLQAAKEMKTIETPTAMKSSDVPAAD